MIQYTPSLSISPLFASPSLHSFFIPSFPFFIPSFPFFIPSPFLFKVDYPEIVDGLRPRHRFMSAYEQRIEAPDKSWQYLLFAAEPYETIAFKVTLASV